MPPLTESSGSPTDGRASPPRAGSAPLSPCRLTRQLELPHQVEQFLCYEAELLDDRRYRDCCRNQPDTEVDIWAGQRQDVVRPTPAPPWFSLAPRTILLDQNVVLSNYLSVFF
jgi:Ring hydroxylating beta subunit